MAADRRVLNCGDRKAHWNPVSGCSRPRVLLRSVVHLPVGTTASGKQAGLAHARRNSHALSSSATIRG